MGVAASAVPGRYDLGMTGARTPKALALGQALRQAREGRSISLRGLAELAGKPTGTLSRWETGVRSPSPEDVASLLAVLEIDGAVCDELLAMARGTDEPLWLATTLPEQHQQLAALLSFEREATSIADVSPLLIPGLCQTASYARSIMSLAGVPDSDVDTRVAIRLGRRDVLQRQEPAQFTALIGETALQPVIGGPAVMLEQLRHLLWLASLSNVELRVIPARTGWHPGHEGPFILVQRPDEAVVHLENRRSGLFLHRASDVALYQQAVRRVSDVALGPPDSAEVISQEIKRLDV
ncbi:MAG: helix-turn-helix domain-containing protein [Candidatus Dormibacteraceae bacterium]